MNERFDTLVVITKPDLLRIKSNFARLVKWLPGDGIIFIGHNDVGKLLDEWKNDVIKDIGRVSFVNENDIIPFDDVHSVMASKMAPLLNGRELPRGITGWYYQQFLKMEYSRICNDEYYMSWDGDTVPCKCFSMFKEDGKPFLDLKHEYNELYFTTMGRLCPGLGKFIDASFISEHMLFKCDIMKRLIEKIESNNEIPGNRFYEKIINCIPIEDIQENGFSEFETYGSFVCLTNPGAYRLREWHSFRLAGEFFDPDKITDEDYEWLSRDFDAISFEKGMFVREDHKNLFDNREYQSKLSARQMLEIAQEEFKEGYKEVW
ncbi:MAG: hypothetical protein IK111_05955 [Lachnospiraceae bacterium]|nr:hypothetical protein [Lachnospiraceae bacterium]